MSDSAILVLGNQLFPLKYYRKFGTDLVVMAEDSGLCTHYKYHKHKIILFLSAMRKFAKELGQNDFKVSYYRADHKLFNKGFEAKLDDFLKQNKKVKTLHCYEIEDKFFEELIINYCKKKKIVLVLHPSPLFMVTRDEFQTYLSKVKKPFMKTFYEGARKKFSILLDKDRKPVGGKWSYDQDNRKKLPKTAEPPHLPSIKHDQIIKEVCDFVESKFKDHPGESENFWIPTTRKESLKWLDHFIKDRLEHFGTYQDSITSRSDFVFHSVLSPMINMGLILPEEVIKKVEKAYIDNPKVIPLNSVEGFIRQVLGWREFVRGVYQNYAEQQWESNFWKHKRKLTDDWYQGTTGIPVLDDAIKKTLKYSYAHHIERLMILSNMMLLCEIHPHNVYQWFMEMYSDSSDWVMGPNVFGMGQFSDGGIFATKPYTCGSNYYLKMSDYKKGDWCETVDGLYWRFIEKHRDFYAKNPRMSMMVKNLDKIDPERKKRIFKAANDFIKKVTA